MKDSGRGKAALETDELTRICICPSTLNVAPYKDSNIFNITAIDRQ